jgi:TRAP-type C4-dicarboxylate transport system permease small subunit
MSPLFWIYWAVTVPFTLIVLATYIFWYRTNKRDHLAMDRQLEESIQRLAERKSDLMSDKVV